MPLIGVTPLWDSKLTSMWMLPGYFNGVTEAGGIPVMLPLTDNPSAIEQLLDTVDGVLVTGGHDLGPNLYHEQPGPHTVKLCPARDRMESVLIPAAIKRNLPVLGICRGLQSLNVMLGGDLWQDLPSEHPSEVNHHGNKPPYDQVVHTVRVDPTSLLAHALWPHGDSIEKADTADISACDLTAPTRVAGCDPDGIPYHPAPYTLGVNSYHHQAIKHLADPLEVMAVAPDGIVEAAFMPSRRFIWGVQWHPEFAHGSDVNQRVIFSALVDAARSTR